MTPYVAVIGPADCDAEIADLARAVGAELARSGAVVVCGGLGGAMEAACQGAASQGGTTLGILPGSDRAQGNAWLSVAVSTGLGQARNAIVVTSADAVIAVGGGYGTLAEIGLALRSGRRVVGLRTWNLQLDGRAREGIVPASTPVEAVALALRP